LVYYCCIIVRFATDTKKERKFAMSMTDEQRARLVREYVRHFAPLMSLDEPEVLTQTIGFISFVCQVPAMRARMALFRGMVKVRRERSLAYRGTEPKDD
jgi:hypothetical protein